ncbi:MAG: hypothetical protein R3D84_03590 [Paracoccaceae bacterium]
MVIHHNEPLIRDGKIVAAPPAGAYGRHHLGAAIGMGYVPCKGETVADAGLKL